MDGEKKQPRGLAAEEVTMPQGENIQETVEDILLKIKQVSGGGKAAAIPAGVTVNEVAFYGNSVIVSLSSTFDELPEVEKSLAGARPGGSFQFIRIGYFCADPDGTAAKPVFNRSVGLKDSWAKQVKKQ